MTTAPERSRRRSKSTRPNPPRAVARRSILYRQNSNRNASANRLSGLSAKGHIQLRSGLQASVVRPQSILTAQPNSLLAQPSCCRAQFSTSNLQAARLIHPLPARLSERALVRPSSEQTLYGN